MLLGAVGRSPRCFAFYPRPPNHPLVTTTSPSSPAPHLQDGQRCTYPVNRSTCEYCPYHAQVRTTRACLCLCVHACVLGSHALALCRVPPTALPRVHGAVSSP